ncbi:MAG: carbon storage regulator CsrA [Negativicutes bacterium]|nr:carbon storage regulator CsrA [Negativicutes bacterium]
MLVLTRRIGEKIMVGDDIVLMVADIRGDSVRLAIRAPQSVKIFRGEIYENIARENQLARENRLEGPVLEGTLEIRRNREQTQDSSRQ